MGKISAMPRKKMLREKSDSVKITRCVAELIDNCIDYWKYKNKYDEKPPLEIHIDIKRDEDSDIIPKPIKEFEMKWNMSIPNDKIKDVLILGSQSLDEEGLIGLWGQGAKIAMHGIARGWELKTFNDENEIIVKCHENWIYEEENWDLYYEEKNNNSNKSLTIFSSANLNNDKWKDSKRDEEFFDEKDNILIEERLRKHIASRYTEFGDIGVNIYLNNEPIELISVLTEESLRRNYLWIPGFEPHIDDWGTIKCPNGRKLTLKIFIGMHRNPSQYEAGVYLYGNGRRFVKAAKKAPLFKQYSPKDVNIRMHVFLDGFSQDIPWGIPEKDGLTDTHYIIPDLAKKIRDTYKPYSKIVTLHQNERYLYTLTGEISDLVQKAGYIGKEADVMKKLLENLRKINEPDLEFYEEQRGKGKQYKIECLRNDFRLDTSGLMTEAKENDDYLPFHLGLAKKVLQKDMLLEGIDLTEIFEDETEEEFELEDEEDDNEEEMEEESETIEEGSEKNLDKKMTQSTLDDFDDSLKELGDTVGIKNQDLIAQKVNKAIKKMTKELKKPGYTTIRKDIIRELLDIK